MIGARSFHGGPDSWNYTESRTMMAIYGENRLPRKQILTTGSDVVNPELRPGQGYHVGSEGKDIANLNKYSKRDPRHVAVSWYSHFYLRPGSPTQWEQRKDVEQETDHLGMMGFENKSATTAPPAPPPVKSDISLLEKLSKIAEIEGIPDTADLEVEEIYEEKDFFLNMGKGHYPRRDLQTETRELLSELRRQSPLL